jgi:O-antigen/teichoic acid export membrane protein
MTFLFLITLLQLLSPLQYGVYSAVLITSTLASLVASLGLQSASARYIPLLRERGDEEGAFAVVKSIMVVSLLLAGIVSGVFATLAPSFSLYYTKSLAWTPDFILGSAWIFAYSLSTVFQGVVQGFKKYVLLAKILFLARMSMVAFTIIGLLLYRDVSIAILAWVVFSAVTVGWALKIVGLRHLFDRAKKKFPIGELVRYSLPIGVAGIALNVAAYADSIVVGGKLGAVSLATYYAAVQISGIMGVVLLTPLTTAFLPEISSSAGDRGGVSNGLRLGIRFVTLGIMPASFFVAAVATQLVTLFTRGDGYLAGAQSLQVIAMTYAFYAMMTVAYYLLQAIGRPFEAMVVGGLSAAADVGLSLVLVPQLGLLGAALSKGLVALIGMGLALYFARDYLQNLDKMGFYAKGIVCSLVPFVVSYTLSAVLSTRVTSLVPYALLSGVAFIAAIKFFRVVSDEDRRYLSLALPLRFKWIVRYIT